MKFASALFLFALTTIAFANVVPNETYDYKMVCNGVEEMLTVNLDGGRNVNVKWTYVRDSRSPEIKDIREISAPMKNQLVVERVGQNDDGFGSNYYYRQTVFGNNSMFFKYFITKRTWGHWFQESFLIQFRGTDMTSGTFTHEFFNGPTNAVIKCKLTQI